MVKLPPKYANASEVLPRKLMSQLRRYFEGGLLWVPSETAPPRVRDREARDREIAEARKRGSSLRELAEKYLLTEERIRQIVRKQKMT